MTNKEMFKTIFDAIDPIVPIESIDFQDTFKGDKEVKNITIWSINEDDVMGHSILASFSIPINADEELVRKFANSCLEVDELESFYND